MDNQRGNIEVSLPGAGESEPTILEVINNRNTNTNNSETEIQDKTETTSSSSSQPLLEGENPSYQQETEKINIIPNTDESNKTLTTEELHKIAKDTLGNINLNNNNNKNLENIETEPPGNILDIESHLIETFENFSVSETSDNGGVVIKECQPAIEEFTKSSQIETETSPKTIIEIEPSIPKIFKSIELDLEDLNIKKQFGIETTEIINNNNNNNTKPVEDSVKTESDTRSEQEEEHQDKNLNSHIEKNINNKSENQCDDLNEKDLIKENVSINLDIGIGINGLQNCITQLEEEEKKKLLDSLPQLDENDSNNLSIQAKKEYYQLLRDYLDKHQDDRPPVPIQTYRWEDLRRAKEKGGYPWTHLYKRPLGPDEEPEIVLLLRKSQEFRFSSESPRSLKKVRIHDQVLIKETERYINDLSDTEDNPEIIVKDNIENIEDNHSLNSESASVSLTSDSVPKKSKLSKLKGILKRNSSTTETKLNSPNKKTEKTTNGEDNNSLHSESAISGISDSVCEGKKSKLNKLKGLVKRQSSDVKSKKPKESASIFYSVSPEDTTSPEESNQTVPSELETKKSKFDKFIDIVKGGKNSSQSKEQTGIDNHSIHSESAIFGLSESEGKQSKLSKLKRFVKRRSGDKKHEDTKSIQSESAVPSKSDSASDKKLKLKKLQGAFKLQKDIEKKEEKLKTLESCETSPSTDDTQSESGLSETVPESKKELIKIKTSDKKVETNQEDTISSKSDSTLEHTKSKLSNLKKIFKRQPDTENKNSEEFEKPTTEINDPTSPDIHTEDKLTGDKKGETKQDDTVSSKSDSTLERKKSKLSNLKKIFKSQPDTENKNSEEFEKPTTEINDATSPDSHTEDKLTGDKKGETNQEDTISIKSDSTLEHTKSKLSNLKKIFKRQPDTQNKNSEEFEKPTTEINDATSPDSHTEDKLTGDKKGETNQEDTISIKSDSTLEHTKSKLSNLKKIFKRQPDTQNKNSEEFEKPTTEINDATSPDSHTEDKLTGDKKGETKQDDTVSSKSDSTLERKKSKLSNLKKIFKSQPDTENKKAEEFEKLTTEINDPTSPDSHTEEKLTGDKKGETKQDDTVSSKSDSTLERKKSKLSNLKKIFKSQPDTENKKAEEFEKLTTEINDPTSPDSHTEEKLTGDKKGETKQDDTVSSKSDSTLERKKSKLSNLKKIFKSQPYTENKKAEELKKPTTEINDPTSPDSHTEDTQSIQSETESSAAVPKIKTTRLKKLKGIVKRRSAAKKPRSKKVISSSPAIEENSTEVVNSKSEDSPKKEKCCHPVMDKLKMLTDKQFKKRNIKKVALKDEEKIILEEQQKILKLRESPKAVRGEIPKFVEKQDSEDLLEIVQLEESPSQKRKEPTSSILIPDEIIELPANTLKVQERQQNVDPSITPEPTVSEILEDELNEITTPPKKALRKMKTHIYEDIENNEPTTIEMKIDEILQFAAVEALKKSLAAQDQIILKDMESNKKIPLDRMGSSEEEIEKTATTTKSLNGINHLAPISSIDSASSDEQEKRIQLSSVAEESDVCSTDGKDVIVIEDNQFELDVKSSLKRESSPSLSIGGDKKVTFSHVEDDAEPHREDIEIPEELKGMPNRWSTMNDHEYEPIGEPQETTSILKKEVSPVPQTVATPTSTEDQQQIDGIQQAEELQRDLEDRYFTSSNTTTPRTESRTDYDMHTNQVDSSALDELPIKDANGKKSFISSAQDRSRKLKAGIRTQAGKVRTKFRRTKKQPSNVSGDSPNATKERKKFKTPEFSKMKMPDMPKFKSPDMSKFKKPEFKKIEFKRPEFTKFNKPDMSKFKIPEKFTSLKLKRSKSFKEEEVAATSIQTGESGTTPESAATPSKKKFEFNFGTYPRPLRRKKIKDSIEDISRVNEVSTVPSTETPPSVKLTTVLRGTRAEGPVGSRWQDKFSDASFGDSESGRFQRYGSEVESFDRESSMERRMKDDLVAQDENELGAIGSVEHKQFADYDEENRAIHEISKIREGEFKQRRPMIHQDSNISEESKDVGWTDKDAMRNKILRHSDMENEGYNNNYASEDALSGSMNTNHETQSTGSSGAKKGVIEEIDDDEFFLRKRGISQDNIEIRQYISSAIREGFDNPVNSLAQLGNPQDEYPDSMLGSSQDQGDFGYDIPPAKPRRIKNYNNFNRKTESQEISQGYDEEQKENYDDNISLPQTGSDYFQNIQPNRPLRKSKKGYSQDSQSDIQNVPYFDDIEKEFYHKELNLENTDENLEEFKNIQPPKPPKRRKKQNRESVEKDSYINGFGGRSVSNTFLQNDNVSEDVIVYRTEHAYVIPLAQHESSITPAASIQRSRSGTHKDEDDRSSLGGDSFTSDIMQAVQEESHEKFTIEMKANDGYAVVRKEPPPRPPPPSRRKRHTQPTGNFATMPHPAKETPPPQRPKKYYSTIGPSRPPRRKTSFGSADLQKSASDITQYEEVEDDIIEQADLQKDLHSGDVIKKMKYRPLPPPPPPPRGKKKYQYGGDDDRFNDDHDGGAEKMLSDIQMNGNYDIEKVIEKCIEVEVSTQTDPLPDDFVCEEFEITDDMKVIEPRNSKTLEDLLREDQGNNLDFNNSTTEENLTKGIQRFRDANQKSFSEKSRNSSAADRSRSHSRPHTPSAIVIEKRVPTPVPNNASETMLQASLTVQPIDDDLESDEHFGEDYPSSTSYQASTVKSVGSHESGDDEKERLNGFIEEERRLKQQEEDRRIMDEIRQREEEEEQEIMEKIRELQRLEEEEEKKTMEKLKELQIEEDNMKKYRTGEQREEDERKRREEEDRRVMEKIRELERQEEEDRKIMEKIRQLEREFADSSEKSPEVDSYFKPEERDYQRMATESPKPNLETYPDPEIELIEPEMSPPPNPPPRKRSSTNILPEDRTITPTVESSSLSPVIENSLPIAETTELNPSVLPNRMAVADLEVERLRVHALQAGHIMVSSLHGSQIGADELECKSGNLVVRNLELPAGFIEEIVERVRTSERSHIPVETQTIDSGERQTEHVQPDQPPERPPLPHQPMFPSEYMHSIPPASFYQLRDPTEEDYQPNMQAPRRRRHHRRRDSSSEDSHRHRSHGTHSPERTVAQLGGQFLQACGTSLLRSMHQVANYVRTSQKVEGGERNIGTLIAIFILMTLGFLFIGMSGKNIHHHHWDYFNPPGNDGRQQQ